MPPRVRPGPGGRRKYKNISTLAKGAGVVYVALNFSQSRGWNHSWTYLCVGLRSGSHRFHR